VSRYTIRLFIDLDVEADDELAAQAVADEAAQDVQAALRRNDALNHIPGLSQDSASAARMRGFLLGLPSQPGTPAGDLAIASTFDSIADNPNATEEHRDQSRQQAQFYRDRARATAEAEASVE